VLELTVSFKQMLKPVFV